MLAAPTPACRSSRSRRPRASAQPVVLLLVPLPPVSLPVPVLPPVPESVSVSVPVLPDVVVPPVVLPGWGPSGEVSHVVLSPLVPLSSNPVTGPCPSGEVSHVVPSEEADEVEEADESEGSSSSHPPTPADSAPATATEMNARALGFLVKLTMQVL